MGPTMAGLGFGAVGVFGARRPFLFPTLRWAGPMGWAAHHGPQRLAGPAPRRRPVPHTINTES